MLYPLRCLHCPPDCIEAMDCAGCLDIAFWCLLTPFYDTSLTKKPIKARLWSQIHLSKFFCLGAHHEPGKGAYTPPHCHVLLLSLLQRACLHNRNLNLLYKHSMNIFRLLSSVPKIQNLEPARTNVEACITAILKMTKPVAATANAKARQMYLTLASSILDVCRPLGKRFLFAQIKVCVFAQSQTFGQMSCFQVVTCSLA